MSWHGTDEPASEPRPAGGAAVPGPYDRAPTTPLPPPPSGEPPLSTGAEPPVGTTRPPAMTRTVLITAAVAALVGGATGIGSYAAFDGHGTTTVGPTITIGGQSAPSTPSASGTVAAAAAVISPEVVTISVAGPQGAGTGSGVLIRSDGYILTNNHVVALGDASPASANQLTVAFSDGRQSAATVTGTDPADDLAVVRVEGLRNVKAATFADSSALLVGQSVVAVGAPLGLSNTVTSGIVSALARPVQAGSAGESIFNAIQTDAAINPGNSGGPLVDLNGHVVGINSAIATASGSGTGQSGNIGIGFAIPSNEATRIAAELIATGRASHAVLGISVQSNSDATSGGPTSVTGARVTSVVANGPAARAGIKVGEVITRIGKQRIDDSTGLIAAVRSYPPGESVQVTVSAGGKTRTLSVSLGRSTSG